MIIGFPVPQTIDVTLPCTSGQDGNKKACILQVLGQFNFYVGLEITLTQGHFIKGSLRIRVEDKEVEELVLVRYLGHVCLPGHMWPKLARSYCGLNLKLLKV